MSWPLSPRAASADRLPLLGRIHDRTVHHRRVKILAERLAIMFQPGSRVLDIGCGDGRVSAFLRDSVKDLRVEGLEVQPRPECAIACRAFDGTHLPFGDDSFDCCLLVDVLHHVKDPLPLLEEASRVAFRFIVIKDHFCENSLDYWTLRLMDWVGNKPHGVPLPYAYQSRCQWDTLYRSADLVVDRLTGYLPLYPRPFSAVFGRGLHFVSRLRKCDPAFLGQ